MRLVRRIQECFPGEKQVTWREIEAYHLQQGAGDARSFDMNSVYTPSNWNKVLPGNLDLVQISSLRDGVKMLLDKDGPTGSSYARVEKHFHYEGYGTGIENTDRSFRLSIGNVRRFDSGAWVCEGVGIRAVHKDVKPGHGSVSRFSVVTLEDGDEGLEIELPLVGEAGPVYFDGRQLFAMTMDVRWRLLGVVK